MMEQTLTKEQERMKDYLLKEVQRVQHRHTVGALQPVGLRYLGVLAKRLRDQFGVVVDIGVASKAMEDQEEQDG